jgi:hypothetical protein
MSTPQPKVKKSSWKRKESALAALPIKENSWPPWAIELLPLAEISFAANALEIADALATAAETELGARFEGTGSQFLALLDLPTERFAVVRRACPEFFDGANACIATVLGRNYPDASLPAIEGDVAARTLVLLLRTMQRGGTKVSTHVKAVHYWLAKLREPALAFPTEVLEEHVRGALADSAECSSFIRADWQMIPTERTETLTAFVRQMFEWGIATPCLPTEYELPDRAPWPVEKLEPVASGLLEQAADFVEGIHMPLSLSRGDVTIALVQRLRQLLVRILDATSRNDGLTAEVLLRCHADTALQLRWLLLKDDEALFERFKSRSDGAERERIDRVRRMYESNDTMTPDIERGLNEAYRALAMHSGRWPELFEVVYGPWSEVASGRMLRELPSWETCAITTAWYSGSDAVHGSWRHLKKYAVERCTNAFHLGHYVCTNCETKSAGLIPVIAALRIMIEALRDLFTWLARATGEKEPEYSDRLREIDSHLTNWWNEHWIDGKLHWHDSEEVAKA